MTFSPQRRGENVAEPEERSDEALTLCWTQLNYFVKNTPNITLVTSSILSLSTKTDSTSPCLIIVCPDGAITVLFLLIIVIVVPGGKDKSDTLHSP